jgi:hypothetical protein
MRSLAAKIWTAARLTANLGLTRGHGSLLLDLWILPGRRQTGSNRSSHDLAQGNKINYEIRRRGLRSTLRIFQ